MPISETTLLNIRSTPDSWKIAVDLIPSTSDEYLLWFCLSVLEDFIFRSWDDSVSVDDRHAVRQILVVKLESNPTGLSWIALNKLIKVLVDIAALEFPDDFSDFFPMIERFCSDAKTVNIGLLLLKTSVEVFHSESSSSIKHTAARAARLRSALMTSNPHVLCLLFSLLRLLSVTAESPRSESPAPAFHRRRPSSVLGLQLEAGDAPMLVSHHPQAEPLIRLALETLQLLFGRVPFAELDFNLIKKAVELARHSPSLSIRSAAVAALNEILSRSLVPSDAEEAFRWLCCEIFKSLESAVKLLRQQQALDDDGFVLLPVGPVEQRCAVLIAVSLMSLS